MPYEVVVTALYIGQGLANTVELIDTALPAPNNVEYLAVYDFGSAAGVPGFAMDTLIAKAENRYNSLPAGQQPVAPYNHGYIDYLYISHLDADHYNRLLMYQWPNNVWVRIRLTIANIMIGGTTPNSIQNFRNLLQLNAQQNPVHNILNPYVLPLAGYTHPAPDPYDQPAVLANGYINIPFDGNKHLIFNPLCYQNSNEINTSSTMLLMSVLENGASQFSALFTGDATRDTFIHFLNQVIQNPPPVLPPPPVPPAPIPYLFDFNAEAKFMTIPHHGSYTTARDNNNGGLVYLTHLLANYPPHIACASAFDHNGFHHPSKRVWQEFEYRTQNKTNSHRARVYYEDQQHYKSFNVYKECYTTYMFSTLGESLPMPLNHYRNLIVTYNTVANPLYNFNQHIHVVNNEFN